LPAAEPFNEVDFLDFLSYYLVHSLTSAGSTLMTENEVLKVFLFAISGSESAWWNSSEIGVFERC